MIKKQLVKIGLIAIILTFVLQLNVYAAVITSTDKQVESGSGNVTISVASKQALGAYTLKLADSAGLELVSASGGEISADKKTITGSSATGITGLGAYTFKIPIVSSETTYKIKFSITGMETTSLDEIQDENNTAVLTVKPKPETPPPSSTPETGNNNTPTPTPDPAPKPEEPKKSSDASLTNLGIKPNDFSGFKKDKTEYSVEVPNSVASVEVYARPVKGATVIGTGKVDLKEGDNTVKVKVTAEDGKTTKTYTLSIKRKTAEEDVETAGEARLKTLGIKPKEYDFSGFNSDKTEYSVEVPNDVEKIEIYATAIDAKAQITGTGMITLEEGENELKVEVIAQNGTKNTYIIKVTREESEKEVVATTEEQFGLSILKIEGLTLSPSFEVGTYEYKVELEEDLSSLEIKTKANAEDATVEVIGNENLKEGENVITILVTNKETKEVVTYQIIVNKKIAVQTIQTSWLKPSTWGKEEKIKIAIIIVLIILIIWAIILKVKIGKENKKNKKSGFPGADELDKAIAEHQELSEEEINEMPDLEQEEIQIQNEPEEISREESMQNYLEEIAKNRMAEEDVQYDVDEKPRKRGKGRHF